jgi:hypothetical protein
MRLLQLPASGLSKARARTSHIQNASILAKIRVEIIGVRTRSEQATFSQVIYRAHSFRLPTRVP